jgi:iron-sulfur cluster assembly protein
MARPRPKLVTLTDEAAERVKALMAARPDEHLTHLRVGVKNGGCAGMEYTMEYASEKAPLDEEVEDKGVKILVDAKAVLFLLGTEIGYEVTKLKSGFVFSNPNQTDACGCGESVTIKPFEADEPAPAQS